MVWLELHPTRFVWWDVIWGVGHCEIIIYESNQIISARIATIWHERLATVLAFKMTFEACAPSLVSTTKIRPCFGSNTRLRWRRGLLPKPRFRLGNHAHVAQMMTKQRRPDVSPERRKQLRIQVCASKKHINIFTLEIYLYNIHQTFHQNTLEKNSNFLYVT